MDIRITASTDGAPGRGVTYYVVASGETQDYQHNRAFRCEVGWHEKARRQYRAAQRLLERIQAAGITEAHCANSPHWHAAVAYSFNDSDGSDGITPVLTHVWR